MPFQLSSRVCTFHAEGPRFSCPVGLGIGLTWWVHVCTPKITGEGGCFVYYGGCYDLSYAKQLDCGLQPPM